MVHEKLIKLDNEQIGLKGWIAIHTLKFGPAFGGIRIVDYSNQEVCRKDALKLSEAMTYKCLINDIPGGGGKAVLMRNAIKDRQAVLSALGDEVEALKGEFYTGPDAGATRGDLEIVAKRTSYVTLENLSPATAEGVFNCIRAACDFLAIKLEGLSVIMQGLGDVGLELAKRLLEAGVRVSGGDIDSIAVKKAKALGVRLIEPEEILSTPCDLFCPCALGGVITPDNVPDLKCRMVVGSANNVLAGEEVDDLMARREIMYMPDFVTNSGGALKGTKKYLAGSSSTEREIAALYDKTLSLLDKAESSGTTPLRVAMAIIARRLGK